MTQRLLRPSGSFAARHMAQKSTRQHVREATEDVTTKTVVKAPSPGPTQEGLGSRLQYVVGDLFSCPATDSLAHCISEDCRMGAGIAVVFKRKFRRVEELLGQKKKPGECAVLRAQRRFVYYLITKKKYNQKPTYKTLQQSLEAMREHCLAHGVTRISMPRIGCGLDRLMWEEVSVIIEEVFQHTDVAITVYTL